MTIKSNVHFQIKAYKNALKIIRIQFAARKLSKQKYSVKHSRKGTEQVIVTQVGET